MVDTRRAADLAALLGIAAAIRGLGLTRVDRLLARVPFRPRGSDREPVRPADRIASDVVRRVDEAADLAPFPVRCLARSVCVRWLLARRGIDAALRIGTVRERGRFRAHAWLELSGEVIGDDPGVVARYRAFDRPVGRPST